MNEKRFYVQKPERCPNRVISGFLPYLPGVVKVVGYLDGREACTHEIVTPGPAVKLEFDSMDQCIPLEENYEVMLTVRAKDEEGHPYFRESALVRFSVEGDADIVAVDNGNLMSSEPYKEDFIHLYRGCASVLIRLHGKKGRVVVSAYSEGMSEGRGIICIGA